MQDYVYISEALTSNEFSVKEVVVESDNGSTKKLILEGIFSTANKINRNKRIYSEAILKRESNKLNEKIKESGVLLGELEHPIGNPEDPVYMNRATKILMERACVAMKNPFSYSNNNVYGKAEIITGDNGLGDKLAALVKSGFIPGISSRGVGGKPTYSGNGEIIVPEDSFRLITYDIVESPSNFNSRLNMILEEEIYRHKEQEKYVRRLWEGFSIIQSKLKN